MRKRRVWAREQNVSRRVFATCMSWMTDIVLGSCACGVLDFPLTSEGRTLARAVAMSDVVSLRVVPVWPMGMQSRSTRPQYLRRARRRGRYFSVFFVHLS